MITKPKKIDVTKLERFNPTRQLNWRNRRAMQMAADNRPKRHVVDVYIRVFALFLRIWMTLGLSSAQGRVLLKRLPFLPEVVRWANNPGDRRLLEAWILSGETYPQIARRLGISCKAVHWYEKLYFHIGDRRQAADWLSKVNGLMPGSMPRTLDQAYKFIALQGGPLVLEAAISGHFPGFWPENEKELAAWFDDMIGGSIARRAHLAMVQEKIPLSVMIKVWRSMKRIEESAPPQTPPFDWGPSIKLMMRHFPEEFWNREMKAAEDPEADPEDETAAGPEEA